MASLKCARCGAHIQVDGTSSCSCVPTTTGRNEVWAFEAFRPRLKASKASKARRAEARTGGPARDDSGGQRMGRRGKGVAVGVAAAVALGTVAFGVDAMSSGPPARNDSARPAVSVSPDPDLVAREALKNASPDEPQTPSPPQSANGGMRPAGEGHEEQQPGSQPPATHDESPSPSTSAPGDAGGASQGGGTGAPGGDDGGASGGGGSQGGDGDDEQGGGLLGGLFGALFGGGGHDDDHGDHGPGDHGDGGDHGGGGHGHGGGGHGGGGHH